MYYPLTQLETVQIYLEELWTTKIRSFIPIDVLLLELEGNPPRGCVSTTAGTFDESSHKCSTRVAWHMPQISSGVHNPQAWLAGFLLPRLPSARK